MCELFGLSSIEKIQLNSLLQEFFSHGTHHPHGWGMAFFYGNVVSLEKEPKASFKSEYLKKRLMTNIESDKMIAHIRLATKGSIDYENTHPFVTRDNCGRVWTLAHNGTIFECGATAAFIHEQQGQTDSERILCYIISKINLEQEQKKKPLSQKERFNLIDNIVCEISSENKLNFIIYDGELMYVHTNYKDSLFKCHKGKATVISTKPLDSDRWDNLPMTTLLAYHDGNLVYIGTDHKNEFIDSEEKMRLLFLDFAAL